MGDAADGRRCCRLPGERRVPWTSDLAANRCSSASNPRSSLPINPMDSTSSALDPRASSSIDPTSTELLEGQGYFSNLMNMDNNALHWDGLGSPSEEQHVPISPEEQHEPIVNNAPSGSARPNQKRGQNFSIPEDELLVAAWLNISTDPVNGTNQTKQAFWKRVYEFFHSNKKFASDRSQNSLMHRWSTIQEHVNKFCGCLARIEGRRQSGVTILDRIQDAKKLFLEEDSQNKQFGFMHCWNMLRLQPKWHDRMKQLAAQKYANKKQKTTKESTPGSATPINVDNSQPDATQKASQDAEASKPGPALWGGRRGGRPGPLILRGPSP